MRTDDLEALLDVLELRDGMRVSFHHHLRNGDAVMNEVLAALRRRGLKDLHLYASALFPVHTEAAACIEEGTIRHVTTNYVNGPVAEAIARGKLRGEFTMQTHGGRARAVLQGENAIDVAFLATPAVDAEGNGSGIYGAAACGSLGYAVEDHACAKRSVLITDSLEDFPVPGQLSASHTDHVLRLPSIGDPGGIVSGTLEVTRDPLGLKIARMATEVIRHSGLLRNGVSFQSGAGGISLAITEQFNDMLAATGTQASFFSGGIAAPHVKALERNLVEKLYDVQCFDEEAIGSLQRNTGHIPISAGDYADPTNASRVIKDLDIVILGASEVDTGFNVNVTTDSYGNLIGGSGGHSDTAEDSKLAIIVAPLFRGRTPLIQERLFTKTTSGEHIDCLVSERGIAVHPANDKLAGRLKAAGLPVVDIETLMQSAHAYTGRPKPITRGDAIGIVEGRRGDVQDTLYRKAG